MGQGTLDRWPSRADYNPHNAPMVPPKQIEEVGLFKVLKDTGVLESPDTVAQLSALVISLTQQVETLQQETVQLRTYLQSLKQDVLSLQKIVMENNSVQQSLTKSAVEAIQKIAVQKQPDVLPVAFNLPESLIAKLETKPQDIQIPVSVPTEQLGNTISDSLQKSLAPVLNAIANRPVSEIHHIDTTTNLTAIHKALDSVADKINSQATTASIDLSPVTKAFESIVESQQQTNAAHLKSLKKLAESVESIGATVTAQGKAIEKALHTKQVEKTKKTVAKVHQDFDGGWTITREEAE